MSGAAFESLELTGKAIIVTGAGSGIRRASAVLLAARGARVAVADLNREGGQETVQQITAAGGTAHFFSTDVSDENSVKSLVADTVDAFDALTGAFNNAGIGPQSVLHETTDEEWNRALDINLTGMFFASSTRSPTCCPRRGLDRQHRLPGSQQHRSGYACLRRQQVWGNRSHPLGVIGLLQEGRPG